MSSDDIWLFSYGTLRQAKVQRELFGRELTTYDDTLIGFELDMITIIDPAVVQTSGSHRHPILRTAGADCVVHGSALRLDPKDLAAADRYETANYIRIPVTLGSGRNAFVYVGQGNVPASSPSPVVSLVEPSAEMLKRLLPVARRIFTETFAKNYNPAEFEQFCERTYSPDGSLARDFDAPGVHWHVAAIDGKPIGYAKLTPLRAPASAAAPGAMELQQIYVLSDWHGTGVADRLMEWGLKTAEAKGAPELYLTVFDHNERAKRFYKRHGFEEVGRCTFSLGDRTDDDRIWRRVLSKPGR